MVEYRIGKLEIERGSYCWIARCSWDKCEVIHCACGILADEGIITWRMYDYLVGERFDASLSNGKTPETLLLPFEV